MPVDSTENNAKKTSKSMKWLTSKLHSHHIDRGKTQQDKLSSQTGTRQVSAPGNGPVNHELNHIKQHVASVQRGSRQTLFREIAIAKAKSESQSRSLLRRKKPPQIPSDPAADQSAYKFLLANGFNLASKNTDKGKTLLWAIQNKKKDAVRLLLNKGAGIEVTDGSQETALHKAASAGDIEVLELLLFRQIDFGARNSVGWTALHIAAANGVASLVRLLLEAGADPSATTLDQRNALHLALESFDQSVARKRFRNRRKEFYRMDGVALRCLEWTWTTCTRPFEGGSGPSCDDASWHECFRSCS